MSQQKNKRPAENMILLLLALICVTISLIQKAKGYEELAGSLQ
jgi:hypothetical protein